MRETKEAAMIVVRDIFQLKFGQAGPAIELWKQVMEINRKLGYGGTSRMLTDLVGPGYYTLGLESTYESVWGVETAIGEGLKDGGWGGRCNTIVSLTEKRRREIVNS